MPEIKSLTRQEPTEAVLELGDDTLTIMFDANRITPRWMHDTLTRLEDTDVMATAEALATVIISWDVTDDDQPFPPDADNIGLLSFKAVQQLYEVVCQAAAPSSAEGNASSPSASEQPSASDKTLSSSPNGSDGSSSPKPSESLSQT